MHYRFKRRRFTLKIQSAETRRISMNRQDMLKAFQTPEEKLLFSKLLDRLFLCQKTVSIVFSEFVSPAQTEKSMSLLQGNIDEKIFAYGGAPGCERQVIGFAPDHLELGPKDFPIAKLKLEFSERSGKSLSHRDFLGSLMGLGLDRGKAGDILVEKSQAFIYVKDDIADFVCGNLQKVGKATVSCSMADDGQEVWEEWPELRPDDSEMLDVAVASLRIDAVASAVFNVSRGKSQELAESGKMSVNWAPAESQSKQVKPGDFLSARGLGRVKIVEVLGETSKGKLRVRVLRYR
jgi:RNA-binding protein YlmH